MESKRRTNYRMLRQGELRLTGEGETGSDDGGHSETLIRTSN